VLDAQRKVLFFNRGCELLTGWTAADVIGQTCDFVSEPDWSTVEAITGALCPPPEVAAGSEAWLSSVIVTPSGEERLRLLHFTPLLDTEGRVERILGTIGRPPEPQLSPVPVVSHQWHTELARLRARLRQRYDLTTTVASHVTSLRALEQVRIATQGTFSVHFRGEPGTGKEHLARLIHYRSDARLRSFVPVDCGRQTVAELLELLGRILRSEREAEPAWLNPGVLYLQRVELLPTVVQQRLVEEWSSSTPPGLRLMSSSHAGLEGEVAADRMSEACSCLLTSLQITLLPLCDRPEEIPLFAQSFLEQLNRDQEHQVSGFVEDVLEAFRRHTWPGNQEELCRVVSEARAACRTSRITMADLPLRFRTSRAAQELGPPEVVTLVPLEQQLARLERREILRALKYAGGNRSRAAALLGLTRPRLYRRMESLGIAQSDADTSGKPSHVPEELTPDRVREIPPAADGETPTGPPA
jgi:DNA-binding NtrC family response regulator